MTDKLEMPLEQFAEAVAKENERLRSQYDIALGAIRLGVARIEQLEAVLRTYACNCGLERDWLCEDRETSSECGWRANKALEGKDD